MSEKQNDEVDKAFREKKRKMKVREEGKAGRITSEQGTEENIEGRNAICVRKGGEEYKAAGNKRNECIYL